MDEVAPRPEPVRESAPVGGTVRPVSRGRLIAALLVAIAGAVVLVAVVDRGSWITPVVALALVALIAVAYQDPRTGDPTDGPRPSR